MLTEVNTSTSRCRYILVFFSRMFPRCFFMTITIVCVYTTHAHPSQNSVKVMSYIYFPSKCLYTLIWQGQIHTHTLNLCTSPWQSRTRRSITLTHNDVVVVKQAQQLCVCLLWTAMLCWTSKSQQRNDFWDTATFVGGRNWNEYHCFLPTRLSEWAYIPSDMF